MKDAVNVTIGDVVEIIGGGTPVRSRPDYYGGDIPWVTPKDMKAWEIDGAQVAITQLGLNNSTARVAPANSVLIVVRSGVLKHTVPVGINRRPVAINQDMKALICSDSVLPDYLARLIKASSGTILKWVRATTADNFPIERLKSLRISLPCIDEQQRIVGVLNRADALRAKRRAAIALLDDLAHSIFLDMFGDPFGNPRGWPIRPLGEFFRVRPNYGTMIPGSSEAGEYLCLRVANIQDWDIDLLNRKYVNLNPKDVDRHTVDDGDLLMARAIASQEHLGKAIIARPGTEKWAFDSHLMRLRFQLDLLLPEYVQALLRSKGGRRLFLKASRRSAVQYNINTKEMASLLVPLPPVDLQRLFTSRLASINEVKARHVSSLARLDDLFGSLQQRAFRGELWDD